MKPNEIDQLIYLFSKLPGLGMRSAKRIVLHLLQEHKVRLHSLVECLTKASEAICYCDCGNLDVVNPCSICKSTNRDNSMVAIVETVADLWALERSDFNGKYHVLGGVLSASKECTPESLRLPELLLRTNQYPISEIIIATNSTIEGQTTAFFITEYFKDRPLKISRLASGIPIGGELDYLDEGTLSAAITSRYAF